MANRPWLDQMEVDGVTYDLKTANAVPAVEGYGGNDLSEEFASAADLHSAIAAGTSAKSISGTSSRSPLTEPTRTSQSTPYRPARRTTQKRPSPLNPARLILYSKVLTRAQRQSRSQSPAPTTM